MGGDSSMVGDISMVRDSSMVGHSSMVGDSIMVGAMYKGDRKVKSCFPFAPPPAKGKP